MTARAGVLVHVSDNTTFSDWEDLIEKLRETTHPMPTIEQRLILIEWEAPDLWALRGKVEETVYDIECNFPGVVFPDRDDINEDLDTDLAKFAWWVA